MQNSEGVKYVEFRMRWVLTLVCEMRKLMDQMEAKVQASLPPVFGTSSTSNVAEGSGGVGPSSMFMMPYPSEAKKRGSNTVEQSFDKEKN